MLSSPNVLAALTVAASIIGPVLAYLGAQRVARRQAEASPYEALASRVSELEPENAAYHRDQVIDRDALRRARLQHHAEHPSEPPPDWCPQWLLDEINNPNPKES